MKRHHNKSKRQEESKTDDSASKESIDIPLYRKIEIMRCLKELKDQVQLRR